MLASMYLLIPLSIFFVLFIAVALWWAIFSGQFENTDEAGESILKDDDSTGTETEIDISIDPDQRKGEEA